MDDITEDTTDLDSGSVVLAIKGGDLDGHLVELLEAIQLRFAHGTTEQKWKVTFDGDVFTQDDLTLAEAATVERITKQSWANLNPVVSATECQAIIAACLHHRQGLKIADAMAKVGAMTTEDAVASIGSYEVDRAPKVLDG